MGLNRSEQMSRIRSRHTTPERILRSALWAAGLRYRLYVRTLAGRPDVVFPKQKLAVFVDGCFWHGCPDHYAFPRTRRDFWSAKLKANVQRDQHQTRKLRSAGWAVLRFWEHEVYERIEAVVDDVGGALAGACAARATWRVVAVDVLDATADVERMHLVTVDGAATTSRRGENEDDQQGSSAAGALAVDAPESVSVTRAPSDPPTNPQLCVAQLSAASACQGHPNSVWPCAENAARDTYLSREFRTSWVWSKWKKSHAQTEAAAAVRRLRPADNRLQPTRASLAPG